MKKMAISESTKAKRMSVERYISYDEAKKLYYVCLNYGKTEEGTKNKKQYVTYKSLKEAREKVHQFYGDKARGKMVVPRQLTVVEWLNSCVSNMRVSGKADTYCYQLELTIKNHIEPYFRDMELQKLQATDIEKYAKYVLDKGISVNTYRKHYDFIQYSLEKAVERDLVAKNVCKHVERPMKKKTDIPFYTSSQMGTLIMSAIGTDMEIFVMLVAYCGIRRGEALGLAWEDVDFARKTIYIRHSTVTAKTTVTKEPKTKESKRIIGGLPEDLMNALLREKQRQKELKEVMGVDYPTYDLDYVVRLKNGKRLRPTYASDKFKKLLADNNLPQLTPHGCRHSFASIANENGMTMYDISRALGHSNIGTTAQIYTDLFKEDNSKTMCTVGKAIFENVI